MEIMLDALERVKLIQVLPPEGNIVLLRMIRDLVAKVGFTAEEHKEFRIQQKDGMIKWNEKGAVPKPFTLADAEVELIKGQLTALNNQNKLTPEMIPIYEKFFP